MLPCACADMIVVLDIETGVSRIKEMKAVDNYSCRYSGICYDNTHIYLISANGKLLKWKWDSEEEFSVVQLPTSDNGELEYYPVQYSEGILYLFSFTESNVIKVNVNAGEVTCVKFLRKMKKRRKLISRFSHV